MAKSLPQIVARHFALVVKMELQNKMHSVDAKVFHHFSNWFGHFTSNMKIRIRKIFILTIQGLFKKAIKEAFYIDYRVVHHKMDM